MKRIIFAAAVAFVMGSEPSPEGIGKAMAELFIEVI